MAVDRSPIVDRNLLRMVASWERERETAAEPQSVLRACPGLDGRTLLELFESQITSRHLDLIARVLKREGRGFYTIGSSGHEGNVVLGKLVRATDPSFLHYRSGALMVERARQVPGTTPVFDTLLSLVASAEDPASGGRHKVFGSRELWVPPQTSTIASHLPKAVGCAFALDRAGAVDWSPPVPDDAVVLCSFGDATVNHATAQAAFNAMAWTVHQRLPLPLLLVCEDNALGISVRTPRDWVAAALGARREIRYLRADGTDLPAAWAAAREAVEHVRRTRRPAFLHLDVVRLLGHAGSDVEVQYRDEQELVEVEARDPLLRTAALVLEAGLMSPEEVHGLYEETRARVAAAAEEAARRPRLRTAAEVVAPLAPYHDHTVEAEACRNDFAAVRERVVGPPEDWPERSERPRHMAVQINRALADALAKYPQMLVFGEDVAGRKGGVYHVTADLTRKAGLGRVFNTLLDETTILGLAVGAAHLGFLPVPEIQYLAYIHNALDQLRGEACSLQFFSAGRFRNPMVVRIASFAYQKGFGGHFHNDNSVAALRDIPGLVIAAPARGDDAVGMLRTCLAAALVDGRVVAFLEPIALYMTRDLYAEGDGLWQTVYPPLDEVVPLGRGRVAAGTEARDLTLVSYANGTRLCMRAARVLEREHGVGARVVDLRWLAPLDEELVLEQARATGRVLVVDEGRRSGGVGEALVTLLAEHLGAGLQGVMRVCGEDTYLPLGPAAEAVLPSEARIVAAALSLMEDRAAQRRGLKA